MQNNQCTVATTALLEVFCWVFSWQHRKIAIHNSYSPWQKLRGIMFKWKITNRKGADGSHPISTQWVGVRPNHAEHRLILVSFSHLHNSMKRKIPKGAHWIYKSKMAMLPLHWMDNLLRYSKMKVFMTLFLCLSDLYDNMRLSKSSSLMKWLSSRPKKRWFDWCLNFPSYSWFSTVVQITIFILFCMSKVNDLSIEMEGNSNGSSY